MKRFSLRIVLLAQLQIKGPNLSVPKLAPYFFFFCASVGVGRAFKRSEPAGRGGSRQRSGGVASDRGPQLGLPQPWIEVTQRHGGKPQREKRAGAQRWPHFRACTFREVLRIRYSLAPHKDFSITEPLGLKSKPKNSYHLVVVYPW